MIPVLINSNSVFGSNALNEAAAVCLISKLKSLTSIEPFPVANDNKLGTNQKNVDKTERIPMAMKRLIFGKKVLNLKRWFAQLKYSNRK